ncbi:hypothetical protein M2137_001394 [Parabacteroides sp. PFB2-10]|uniref:hypothetical protein n=1 Tax=Parabacteroides sp. PFB2-10 TaxID=1742405 RepID=UPI002476863A|nr:hypothetical protein [Parabacteroides sp. PFB2-10]MDH6312619.1 hypothetical protein [Parabacteroides sp. PFB2-10]
MKTTKNILKRKRAIRPVKYAVICIVSLCMASSVLTGCYRDDINDLQKQIDETKNELAQLRSAINDGEVITKVEAIVGGIRVTTNKTTYEIKNGTDGAKGDKGDTGAKGDAAVVEIGENGNWWINGEDTGKPSQGDKGEAGDTGSNASYYLPNVETGTWFEYSDETPEGVDTKESYWPADAITAVIIDGVLYISNVKDEDGKAIDPIALNMSGDKLLGLILMPDWLIDNVPGTKFNALHYYCLDSITEKPKTDVITKLPLWYFACEAVWMRYCLNPPTIGGSIDLDNLIFRLKDTKTVSTRAGIKSGGTPEVLGAELVTNGWGGKDLRVKVRLKLNPPENHETSFDMISLWARLKGQGNTDYIASDYSLAYVDSTSYYNIAYNNQRYNEAGGYYSGEVRKTNSAKYSQADNMNYYYAMELSNVVGNPNFTDTILAYDNTTTGIDLLHMVKTTKHKEGDRQPIAVGGDIPIANYNMGYEFDLVKPRVEYDPKESYDEKGNFLYDMDDNNPYFKLVDGRYLVARENIDDPLVTTTPNGPEEDRTRTYAYVRIRLKDRTPGADIRRIARIAYIKVMLVSQVPLERRP